MLEAAGIEVYLVNARHVKGVPGQKTDVKDAQWLQQLHAAGLLRKSFRPVQEIVPLRYLMRHRQGMVAAAARQVQLMQKVLTEMNIKIQHVFSDVDGVSAQAIIDAILAGERDPYKLAALRDGRCRSALAEGHSGRMGFIDTLGPTFTQCPHDPALEYHLEGGNNMMGWFGGPGHFEDISAVPDAVPGFTRVTAWSVDSATYDRLFVRLRLRRN